MKHAFLIIAHNEYPVLEVLLSMLDDERNDIYLHIDKRATELFQQIKKVKMQKAGFYLIENPIKVYWGDISQVQVEYLLFETALSHGPYAYYHLLSGTDLPIKSQDYIHAFFQQNAGKELKEGKNIRKNISKFLSFPYQKIRKIIKLPILYRESYHFADKVILLSSHFKKPFLEYSHLKDDSKIRIIHNALSFHSFYDLANYNHKKKEVLIVSRLEEEPKRISLALKIWKEIETDHTLSEWKLKIVGHGKMESWYKSLVIHYGLQRVFFEGTKNPEPYYNEASIFMMTSSFEGWGLTLTEAQQYGCVPLAFHSFASLTDIITDKVNGFAIPNDDISLYIKQMKLLMTDEKLRKSMSANAIESSKQFSIEIIIKKWMEVINE